MRVTKKKSALKPEQDIGRFLVDSTPAFWMLFEAMLVGPLFYYFASYGKDSDNPHTGQVNLIAAIAFTFYFCILGLGLGLFDRENRFSRLNSLQLISVNWLISLVLSLFTVYFTTFQNIGRWSLGMGSVGSITIVYFLVHWCGLALVKKYPHRFFCLGERSRVTEILLKAVQQNSFRQYEHADEFEAQKISHLNAKQCDELAQNFREHSVSEIVVSWEKRNENDYADLIFSCLRQGMRVVEDVEYYSQMTKRIPMEALPPAYVLKMGFDIHRPIHGVVKRVIDILVSAIILAIAMPFFFIISGLIRLESRGPAFYFQKRMGRFGPEFKLAKFRTMCDNAESQSYVTGRKDKRITRFGNFLRVLHIDELPQLWNILAGHMSLVGPRPQPTQMVEDISHSVPLFKLRHMLRPGLTGLAQISQGKTTDESQEMMQKLSFDLYYVKNFNIFLDLWILSRTLFRLVQSTW
jgi:exopolysaccharide biosynthesis polyprenyl glycosylphosphotransferase